MYRPQYRRQQPAPNNNLQLTRLPDASEAGAIAVRTARNFARNHKYITGWYLLGLLVLGSLSIYSGRALSAPEMRKYQNIMDSIDLQAEYDATDHYYHARSRYEATRGWFWSCDALCQRNKAAMQEAQARLDVIRAEGNARMSDAKAVAGLSSNLAISEFQDSFWQYFAAGKRFAKRQTGWDIMWMTIRGVTRGRDESWAEYAVKILLHLLMNFTMGLVSALVFFVIGLWNIIRQYQPNPVVALVVFLAAAAAATSFVVTYLFGLAGAAFGAVFGVAKLAESTQRGRIAEQQRRDRIGQGYRAHYD